MTKGGNQWFNEQMLWRSLARDGFEFWLENISVHILILYDVMKGWVFYWSLKKFFLQARDGYKDPNSTTPRSH